MYKQIYRNMIAFMSPECGVGKTASAWATAVGLREINGRRPLAVDLDERGDLTRAFGVDISSGPTIREVLAGEATVNEAIRHTPLGDIIPAGRPFTEEMKDDRPPVKLIAALSKLDSENDIIVADAPVRYMDAQIFLAADSVVVPYRPDAFDADKFAKFLRHFYLYRSVGELNINMEIRGMLPIFCDPASTEARETMKVLAEFDKAVRPYGLSRFEKYIRECPELPELMASRTNIFDCAAARDLAADYTAIIRMIDGRPKGRKLKNKQIYERAIRNGTV